MRCGILLDFFKLIYKISASKILKFLNLKNPKMYFSKFICCFRGGFYLPILYF